VRGADAWLIVKLLETKAQSLVPLDQVKPQLSAALRQARTQQATNAYLADMLKKEPVQINEIGLAAKLAAPK
jgi:parvulin-like peptidyl-prolyl isomerase